MGSNSNYRELVSTLIRDKTSLVISEYIDGTFTIAQRVLVEEDGRKINIFLKGTIKVMNIDGLINIRDALNAIIEEKL